MPSFRGRTCATVGHRMPNPVAGTRPVLEPAPFREGPCAKQTLGRGCAFGQSPKKGRHRSLCVQLLLLATPCGASNVVEQVPQSRWRGTAPCAVPRSSPFLTIPSGASLYPTACAVRDPSLWHLKHSDLGSGAKLCFRHGKRDG